MLITLLSWSNSRMCQRGTVVAGRSRPPFCSWALLLACCSLLRLSFCVVVFTAQHHPSPTAWSSRPGIHNQNVSCQRHIRSLYLLGLVPNPVAMILLSTPAGRRVRVHTAGLERTCPIPSGIISKNTCIAPVPLMVIGNTTRPKIWCRTTVADRRVKAFIHPALMMIKWRDVSFVVMMMLKTLLKK